MKNGIVDENRHQLLTRPSESKLVGNAYADVPYVDDATDKSDWYRGNARENSIFDKSTDLVDFLTGISYSSNDTLDIHTLAFFNLPGTSNHNKNAFSVKDF